MDKKLHVAIIFGGQSAEHEVSIISAKNVYQAIDKNKYEVSVIYIGKDGEWFLWKNKPFFDEINDLVVSSSDRVALLPGSTILKTQDGSWENNIDVVFPVLHGTNGEDGAIQGLLKMVNIPYIGADVLGSAIGMDKDVQKRLLKQAGVAIAQFITMTKGEIINFDMIEQQLKLPFFVKPANAGSSVGVHKVKTKEEYAEAINDAFLFDSKIIVEEAIIGRELEVSVLGNSKPIASLAGEIITSHHFYDYEAKYDEVSKTRLIIPALISRDVLIELQLLAVKVFQVLCCRGMGRVDFFLRDNGEVLVNEINTIPGFTDKSMYPKLWEVSGITCTDLINRLIQLAIEKTEK